MTDSTRRGYLAAVAAYLWWGLSPLFWRILADVPAPQLVGVRILQTLPLAVLVLWFRDRSSLARLLANWRVLVIHLGSALLIGTNWLVFIYGIANGFVVETSLGYFINPLLSVLLGIVVLRERLSPATWLAGAIAFVGVVVLAVEANTVPWIALVLAFSFATYGLVRKMSPLGPIEGLAVEASWLTVPSIGLLAFISFDEGLTVPNGWILAAFALAGAITAVPLLLFTVAARAIPLSAVGLMQYLAPSIQFFLGIWVFGEDVSVLRWVGFVVVWLALVLFAADRIRSFSRNGSERGAPVGAD